MQSIWTFSWHRVAPPPLTSRDLSWDWAALVIMCQIKTFSPASHPLEETKFGILLKLFSRNFLAIVFTDIYKQIQFPVCSKRRQQRKPALGEFL